MYARAYELQSAFVTTLHNHLSMWHRDGLVEKINAWIKLADLSIKAEDVDGCSKIVNSLLSEITDDLDVSFYSKVARCVARFCVATDTSLDSIYERFDEFLSVSALNRKKLIETFKTLNGLERAEKNKDIKQTVDVILADKIAAYTNASVELFETLFENGFALGYRETLISAYNRIIDYCKTVGLGTSVAEKAIDRIADLRLQLNENIDETENGKKTLQSLKVYLGQALPDTGNYDVFISHKSADDKLADKVYDYLIKSGFEAFCDHHSLGELRDSNYDRRVMDALQKSKHLVLVASSPDYVKDGWVYNEWHHFYNDKRENRRNGNLIMVLSDDLLTRKRDLPYELQDEYEIIKTSEFRDRISNYLW